jgi:hypothetical protein
MLSFQTPRDQSSRLHRPVLVSIIFIFCSFFWWDIYVWSDKHFLEAATDPLIMDYIKDQTLVVDIDIGQFTFGLLGYCVPKEHGDTRNPENGVTAQDGRCYIVIYASDRDAHEGL